LYTGSDVHSYGNGGKIARVLAASDSWHSQYGIHLHPIVLKTVQKNTSAHNVGSDSDPLASHRPENRAIKTSMNVNVKPKVSRKMLRQFESHP
jgi:hypothetical protein